MAMFCSSFVCKNPFRIFSSSVLVVMYCFSLYLSWKVFIPPSILNDSFAGWSILEVKLSSFSAQNTFSKVVLQVVGT
jgi:hypothetical protein